MNLFHEAAKVQISLSRAPEANSLRRVFAELGDPRLPLAVDTRPLGIHEEDGALLRFPVPEFAASLPSGFRVASYRDDCSFVVQYRTLVSNLEGQTITEFAGNRGALAYWYLQGRHDASNPEASYAQRPSMINEG